MVGDVEEDSRRACDEQPMVFISRPIISERVYVGLIRLVEIALVRSTYARWCGGTAAKAASYPIRKSKY